MSETQINGFPIHGIELKTEGDDLVVSIYKGGKYIEVIRERREGPISHHVTAFGISAKVENFLRGEL